MSNAADRIANDIDAAIFDIARYDVEAVEAQQAAELARNTRQEETGAVLSIDEDDDSEESFAAWMSEACGENASDEEDAGWQRHEDAKVLAAKAREQLATLRIELVAAIKCNRCGGTGSLPCFNHVANGVCFGCNGTKVQWGYGRYMLAA